MDAQEPSLKSPLISQEETLEESRHRFTKNEILEEVNKLLILAGPLISASFFTFLLQTISVMFVGHLGELALSGASMATSFASMTGFSILVSYILVSNGFLCIRLQSHKTEMLVYVLLYLKFLNDLSFFVMNREEQEVH